MSVAMTADTLQRTDHAVVRLAGPLSASTTPEVREPIAKALAERGRVVVDLSALRVTWEPAVSVFLTALSAAGGWPTARLVLCGASLRLAAALGRSRVPDTVPLAADPAAACAMLDVRPPRVSRHRDLPCHTGSVAAARGALALACADWDVADLAETTALVANELVTNVVEHARTSCRLTMALDGRGLHVGVRDFGAPTPLRTAPIDPFGARGRGLHLVASLSSAWGVLTHADGKTVWATVPLLRV